MNYQSIHGFRGKATWPAPKLVAESDKANRADQGNKTLANEYLDDPEVLEAKMEIIANMIKKSKMLITYTGAGLSKSSGIPDYATKAEKSIVNAPKIASPIDAQPTYAHFVLTALFNSGYLKYWVQQNHDGLPQKAGFPQEKINEIHGAWYDPSNPVVQFSGNLRSDLFQEMTDVEETADMMAKTPAKKSLKNPPEALGTIIINIQKTPLDEKCAVRVWATLDDAFKILAKKLDLKVGKLSDIKVPDGDIFHLPYDENGALDHNKCMVLNLSEGAQIKIPVHGAMNEGCVGEILGRTRHGHWEVQTIEKKGFRIRRLLGWWWIDSAIRGAVPQLPVINAEPKMVDPSTLKKETQDNSSTNNNNNSSDLTSAMSGLAINSYRTLLPQLPKSISVIQSHHVPVKNNDKFHTWTLRLEDGAEKFVSQVTYKIHPTFHPNELTIDEPPFLLERTGWGVFVVVIEIRLKSDYGSRIIKGEHELTFNGEGDVKVTPIDTA